MRVQCHDPYVVAAAAPGPIAARKAAVTGRPLAAQLAAKGKKDAARAATVSGRRLNALHENEVHRRSAARRQAEAAAARRAEGDAVWAAAHRKFEVEQNAVGGANKAAKEAKALDWEAKREELEVTQEMQTERTHHAQMANEAAWQAMQAERAAAQAKAAVEAKATKREQDNFRQFMQEKHDPKLHDDWRKDGFVFRE